MPTSPATSTPAYDDQNIFAKILRGEVPCTKVYEDENTLAMMDIMPRTDGHVLVLPKAASRNILDIAPADLAAVMVVAQKIAGAQKSAFGADGITVQHFCEDAGGQVVFHTHVHVLPRHTGIEMRPPGTMADSAVLENHAQKIRSALTNDG